MKVVVYIVLAVMVGCNLEDSPLHPGPAQIHEPHVPQLNDNVLPKVFAAFRSVETGGHPDPYNARGKAGELGPFQITRAYYEDAIEHDKGLTGIEFEGVRDSHIARIIMMAYWDRYAAEWTAEELCRLHNGGPSKRYTDGYWDKCKMLIQ